MLQQNGEREAILDGLPGALPETRHHRVGGVTEQRHMPALPIPQWRPIVDALRWRCWETRRRHAPLPRLALTVLLADDHERLLRKVAHEGRERFICCTTKVGATMVPGLLNPAEIAGRRSGRCSYGSPARFSRPPGPGGRKGGSLWS